VLNANDFNYEKDYTLRLPADWGIYGEDYETEILSISVNVSKINAKSFLITSKDEDDKEIMLLRSVSQQETRGWIGNIDDNGIVRISGLAAKKRFYYLAGVELTGDFVGRDAILGSLTMKVGVGGPEENNRTLNYSSEWAMEPVDIEEHIIISHKVRYHGPPLEKAKMWAYSIEERAKWPVNDDSGIKYIAREEPKERERIYRRIASERKPYYDKLLQELTWDEMRYTPGILLLIDHIASLEEADRVRIAKAYVRDGSVQFFDGISYGELQKTPPLFAILHAAGRMDQGEVEALRRESDVFDGMYRVYEQIPEDDRAELSLHELMVEVSRNLPVNIRKQYLERSEKLQEYVATSRGDDLRPLYR
jgi:hypothetical protein